VNDLAATVASLPHLTPDQVETLHDGIPNGPDPDVYGIVAPGTGLGEAVLLRNRSGTPPYIPISSEGGHGDLAPTNEEQIALVTYLLKKFKRVSLERVLCGPGLVNIYEFLRDEKRAAEPPEMKERLREGDKAATISKSGLDEEFEITTRALDIFAELLGTEAGNMMLRVLAFGGVYLGGGIPPRIIPKLRDGSVLRGYFNKGRLTETVRSAPLRVVMDDHAALIGAAAIASALN
jgi:glucokinase